MAPPVGAVSACYAVLAVTAGVANLVLTPRLSTRVGMRPLALGCLSAGALAIAATTAPASFDLPGSLAIAVALAAIACLALAIALSAAAVVLSSAAPADRQGTVLGNNAALLVLGEVIGVSGGAFLAGIAPALPLLVLAAILVLAFAATAAPRSPTTGRTARAAPPSAQVGGGRT